MDLRSRSYQPELLDLPDIPAEAIRRNMHELDIINTYLGGHHITVQGIRGLLGARKTISICEIGCGGGDNLLAIRKWCNKKNIRVHCTGIDINPYCIEVARSKMREKDAVFIVSDFRAAELGRKPDIVFSSLFCHHFSDQELVAMLQWMQSNCTTGFFINDLHRHRLAYYSIKMLTRIFSKSYLVKHDAPLSVLRGFSRKEWETLLHLANITAPHIRWKWAFRWLITVSKNPEMP